MLIEKHITWKPLPMPVSVVRSGLTALSLLLPIYAFSAPAPASSVPPFDLTCKYEAAAKNDSQGGIPKPSSETPFDGHLKWDGKNLELSGSMILNPLDALVFRNNHGPYILDHPKTKRVNRKEFGDPNVVAVAIGFTGPRKSSNAEQQENAEEFYSVLLQYEKGQLASVEINNASFELGVLANVGKAQSAHCTTTLRPL
ncbi:hypothetical protein [Bordetella sp. N]|uniref:hypothetical protein n=1 Tax=Bordetella sp. N TaxID=1746199 RepID=UPI00070FCB50|nr:hypothetical protein [Bordetella sp. N]ALM82825.1 hypothetical protein ASB57_07555 [Bordetella sp. N]